MTEVDSLAAAEARLEHLRVDHLVYAVPGTLEDACVEFERLAVGGLLIWPVGLGVVAGLLVGVGGALALGALNMKRMMEIVQLDQAP